MKFSNKPLSKADLDELARVLDGIEVAPTPSQLGGYFTALATAPLPVPPSEWVDEIFGADPASSFESVQDAERAVDLVTRFYNQIVRDLARDRFTYPTQLEERALWCHGYMKGAQPDEIWRRAFEKDERVAAMLFPIALGAGDIDLVGQEDSEGNIIEDPTPHIASALESVPEQAFAAYLYFEKVRQPVGPARSNKVGRNEPCPCGSGKKYKRCCLLRSN